MEVGLVKFVSGALKGMAIFSLRGRDPLADSFAKRICTFVIALLFLGAFGREAIAAGDHYRFGVLPLQSPTKLAGMFMPLVTLIEESLGQPVQFVTAPSFSRFMERVAKRQYHLIYLNPLLFAQAREYGYHAVAKVAGEPFTGILVARRTARLNLASPGSLPKGLRIGFPDPEAYAATVMTRQYLERLGIDVDKQFQVEYFGSQDSALIALHAGLVDLVGTWRPSYRSMPASIRGDLKIIAETPPQPQMPIAVRDDMPTGKVKQLVELLTHLEDTPAGRRALEAMGFREGFARASDAEYMSIGREEAGAD